MNQKGVANIVFIVIAVVLAIAAVGYIKLTPQKTDTLPVACTADVYQCPDGSYVSRTGPNCEFTKCPETNPSPTPTPVSSPTIKCTSDAHCPSARYTCEETVGMGTVCPSDDPSCISASTIVEGVCKLKEGNRCQVNSDCAGGRLCYAGFCTNPTGNQCSGPNDTSCPSGYECVQGCGSPVPRLDDPPPPYYCKLKGHVQMCPICLSKNTLIDTPSGAVPVQQLKEGMAIWTANEFGERVPAVVVGTTETPVPSTHQVVHLVLNDGRNVFASPGHPTADRRIMGNLVPGDIYDGARIETTNRMSYKEKATYDVLPSGKTGFYWANGILLGSTLR